MHMKSRSYRTLLMSVVVVVLAAAPLFSQARRVALVIGNSAYQNVPTLQNPSNDAADMAAALGKLGFEVIPVINGTYADMDNAIVQFSRKLVGAQAGLFFYAGHGVQSNGLNYLLPVDVNIEEEFQLKQKALDSSYVLDAMNAAGVPLNVVILDACRIIPGRRAVGVSAAREGSPSWQTPPKARSSSIRLIQAALHRTEREGTAHSQRPCSSRFRRRAST